MTLAKGCGTVNAAHIGEDQMDWNIGTLLGIILALSLSAAARADEADEKEREKMMEEMRRNMPAGGNFRVMN